MYVVAKVSHHCTELETCCEPWCKISPPQVSGFVNLFGFYFLKQSGTSQILIVRYYCCNSIKFYRGSLNFNEETLIPVNLLQI